MAVKSTDATVEVVSAESAVQSRSRARSSWGGRAGARRSLLAQSWAVRGEGRAQRSLRPLL